MVKYPRGLVEAAKRRIQEQHKTSTEHGKLLEMTKERLLSRGYKVLEE